MEDAYIPAFILTLLEVVAAFMPVPGFVFTTIKPVSDVDYVDEDGVCEYWC